MKRSPRHDSRYLSSSYSYHITSILIYFLSFPVPHTWSFHVRHIFVIKTWGFIRKQRPQNKVSGWLAYSYIMAWQWTWDGCWLFAPSLCEWALFSRHGWHGIWGMRMFDGVKWISMFWDSNFKVLRWIKIVSYSFWIEILFKMVSQLKGFWNTDLRICKTMYFWDEKYIHVQSKRIIMKRAHLHALW